MLLVPRSAESHQGIEVNALAFAGALFVRDDRSLGIIDAQGPMAVLRGVARPKG
jgi:ATP adenylyltransferase